MKKTGNPPSMLMSRRPPVESESQPLKLLKPLKIGCYLMSFKPAGDESGVRYVGTLRVTGTDKKGRRISGDLYQFESIEKIDAHALGKGNQDSSGKDKADHPLCFVGEDQWRLEASEPISVPIFPEEAYQHYIEVEQTDAAHPELGFRFRAHKYSSVSRQLAAGVDCRLELTYERKKAGWRNKGGEVLSGTLSYGSEERGKMYLQYLGPLLRRAQIRVFRIPCGETPPIRFPGDLAPAKKVMSPFDREQAAFKEWKQVFRAVDWDVEVSAGLDTFSEAPDNGVWTPYDLAAAATALPLRDENWSKDGWIYDLLCVPEFDNSEYLGVMFDSEATDFNQRPREAAALAALKAFPKDGGAPYQDACDGRLYFRTALHEVGHCMNLTHDLLSSTLMDTTDELLKEGMTNEKLRKAAELKFSREDVQWLQHGPDIAIRPGGRIARMGKGTRLRNRAQTTTSIVHSAVDLCLNATTIAPSFPLGAPVRLDYQVINQGKPGSSLMFPSNLSLRSGHLSGRVFGPDQVTRFFRSAYRCCDSTGRHSSLVPLLAGDSLMNGAVLLRGVDGPLFPLPGRYRVELEVRWDWEGPTYRVAGETTVVIDEVSSSDATQAGAAAQLMNEPHLMPAIVQGNLSAEGMLLLSAALNSPVLEKHYAGIALKCYQNAADRTLPASQWAARFQEAATLRAQRRGNGVGVSTSGARRAIIPSGGGGVALIANHREASQLSRWIGKGAGTATHTAKLDPDAFAWLEKLRNL